MLVADWIDTWYKLYKAPYLKKTSLDSIKYTLAHIVPKIGNFRLVDIKGIHIQELLNDVRDRPNTMVKVKVLCGDIFSSAYNNQFITFNPMLAVRIRSVKKKKRKSMTMAEQRAFETAIKGCRYELLYLTYLYTGARRNEVLYSLNIDKKNNLIHIGGTKTACSVRTVPLFPLLKEKLAGIDYKKYYNSFMPDYVTKRMRKICRSIGLNGFCVHSLRNTFATRCLEAGVGLKTIQTWLGHSELATTMDIYVDKSIFNDKNNSLLKLEIEKFTRYLG